MVLPVGTSSAKAVDMGQLSKCRKELIPIGCPCRAKSFSLTNESNDNNSPKVNKVQKKINGLGAEAAFSGEQS